MHVKITSGTIVDGQRRSAGDVIEVTPETAKTLFGARKALECEAPKKRGRKKKADNQQGAE